MQADQIIVLVTPLFLLLIALEYWVGVRRGRNTYRLNDALSSIGLGMLSQLVGVLSKAMTLGIYVWVYRYAALWPLPADSPWVWAAGLLLYDFLYYWHHRFGHTTALFWAAHAVHHQSEDYNLSTALRQTSSGWLAGWIFYLPMALIGFPPLVFGVVGLVDLLYQFWVHTQQIGRLGWFDRWFCSPSNHRVHHAVNERYLDRNYGGILIIWDRLFGSFQEELDAEPCVYGTRDALRSWNPLVANWHVYGELLHKMRRVRGWRQRLRVWWEPAHWQPEGPSRSVQPAYDPRARQRYDPVVSARRQWLALLAFVLLLGLSLAALWWAQRMAPWQQGGCLLAVAAGLVGVARLCSGAAGARVTVHSGGQIARS
jgi:sterol desaturase/sphingolipid hydroxylase (fatty acid hydroxylase superfamily)